MKYSEMCFPLAVVTVRERIGQPIRLKSPQRWLRAYTLYSVKAWDTVSRSPRCKARKRS